ncbi:MAG TPA: ZIP family metal transporter [Thermofilum sp.]|nr:ZIP family metal transporter [Thermofilum sp.]
MRLEELLLELSGSNPLTMSVIGGLAISLFNAVGALPVLVIKNMPQKASYVGLGFAAGVMLAASFTSLIKPGIELGGVIPVLIGIALGAASVSLADSVIPHLHAVIGREGVLTERLRAIWLFVIAITLHNMPEGLAVGVGFGSGNIREAIVLMLAIGLQNVPEGLSVGFALLSQGSKSRLYAYLVSVLSGFVELPLSTLGTLAVISAKGTLPYAMGFAAGAMIFVISDEIVPETHRLGHERVATYGLIAGFMLMLYLDVILG